MICKWDAQGQSIYKSEWMCYHCLVLWCVSGSKVPLACVWHEERFHTAGRVPWNGMGDLADGKPWVSMLLSQIGSTIPTRVTFLTFGLSTNVPLTLHANQLATRIICMKRSESWLITCAWLCNNRLLGQVGA